MSRSIATLSVNEAQERMRVHDRLIAIACGYGYETDEPLTDDGNVACIQVARMVRHGTSAFTPSDFGESMGWSHERSTAAIEEIVQTPVTCHVTCGRSDMSVIGHVLEAWKLRAVDTGGTERIEYHITGLSDMGSWLDGWGDADE